MYIGERNLVLNFIETFFGYEKMKKWKKKIYD